MSGRIHLHIGPRKTGTTYLQRCLVARQDALRQLGWTYPLGAMAGERGLNHERLLMGASSAEPGDRERLLRRGLAKAKGDVILSGEALATLPEVRMARLVARLAGHETHVVITARALHRVLPSLWQQHVRNGRGMDFEEFVGLTLGPCAPARESRRVDEGSFDDFWQAYALAPLIERWLGVAGRVTIVTVPSVESSPTVVWERFLAAVGLDDGQRAALPAPESVPGHPGLSLSEAMVLREINRHLRKAGMEREQRRAWSIRLVDEVFATRANRGQPLTVPTDHWSRVVERTQVESEQLAAVLTDDRVRLVGSIDDLHVPELPPREPDGSLLAEEIAVLGGQCIAHLQRVNR